MENAMMGAGLLDLDPPMHHQFQHHQMQQQPPMADRSPPSAMGKRKGVSPSSISLGNQNHLFQNCSDEEEERSLTNEDNGAEDHLGKNKKGLPWQRMKWTDEMVRLLISVVACVEDDGGMDGGDGPSKRKMPASGVLQKKGKWKTVSKLMLEKGCYVSPQQCEDKFNDLNKRYKRLNEILGRGTTCQVVENPNLLDSMHHVTPKGKEDVRKILSSKHLFYREMCAYHNGQRMPNSHELAGHGACGVVPASVPMAEDMDAASEDEDDDEEDRNSEFGRVTDGFQAEIDLMLGDGSKSMWERRDWLSKRRLQLEEERMEIQVKAFELEKSRFKWQRFRSKKDGELERLRLENERMSLENQRMSLQLRQIEAEMEINRVVEPMSPTGFGIMPD